MLVQYRPDEVRLITQHDHALVSGRLAEAWGGRGFELPAPRFETLLAVALHDIAWLANDQVVAFDARTGLPCDFNAFPLAEKLPLYQRGVDRTEAIHPYAGLLNSLHFAGFGGTVGSAGFQAAERQRQLRLQAALGLSGEDLRLLDVNRRFLALCDNFSLIICLTPPGALPESRPAWLKPDILTFAARPWSGAGTEPVRFELTWVDPDTVTIRPFPFREAVQLKIPFRTLSPGGYADEAALRAAHAAAPLQQWMVFVRGEG